MNETPMEVLVILAFLFVAGVASWALVIYTSRRPRCRVCDNPHPLNEGGYCQRCAKYVQH